VARPAGAERLTDADDRALGELGRRFGDVLRTRQLDAELRATLADLRRTNEQLVASRARLVAVADQERRRLERDLHDGVQQHLVALAVNVGIARSLLAEDPDGAAEMLDQLGGDLRTAVQQLRDLAHGIYPPLLMESGLARALPAAARRSPLPTVVDVELDERPSQAVEAALYFCCLEALQNATKHAPAAHISVQLTRPEPGLLRLRVSDDGPGFDPATISPGQGLQNMADRLGAVGGSITIDTAPGRGVSVMADVPWVDR
jgi:signal transduction histidine kinase